MLYEDQAVGFDERAGLPTEAAEAIIRGLVSVTGLSEGDLLLDVGAGTGLLSIPLLQRSIRYIGFDRSPAMLEVFRRRLDQAGVDAELVVADGNDRWPAADRSVAVVFSARALHHLDPAHVVSETRRVLRSGGGWLVLGRVRRPNDSVKATLRRQMRRLLEEEGITGRSHESQTSTVFSALEQGGGTPVEPLVAARWTRRHRPADSVASWEGKEGLAGIEISRELKAGVLAKLRAWAAERYGDLDRPLDQEEFFELTAVDLRNG